MAEVEDVEFVWVLAAIESAQNDLIQATNEAAYHRNDAQEWAKNTLMALKYAHSSIFWLQQHLAAQARTAGLTARAIGEAAGVNASTALRWVDRGRLESTPRRPALEKLNPTGDDEIPESDHESVLESFPSKVRERYPDVSEEAIEAVLAVLGERP